MINTKEYIEVTLKIEPFSQENAELVVAELSELPYNSFMEDTDPDGNPVLLAYIQKSDYDARALKLVLGFFDFKISWSANMMESKNWNKEWESSFEPIVVGKQVTVRAPHHKGLKKTRFNIVIDPQMAFGTGHHETTYMMMETMLEHEEEIRGRSVMDMGCGTGVLAILAAKMRASRVYGIDIDAVAAQSACDNARANRVSRTMQAFYGDASLLQRENYDLLLANIHKNIILQDLDTYANSIRKPGMRYSSGASEGGLLMLSGFYDSDAADITAAASKLGLEMIGQKSKDGWSCLLFRRFRF